MCISLQLINFLNRFLTNNILIDVKIQVDFLKKKKWFFGNTCRREIIIIFASYFMGIYIEIIYIFLSTGILLFLKIVT